MKIVKKYKEDIASSLRKLRKSEKLTQEQLAEKLSEFEDCENCSAQHISFWERGIYVPEARYIKAYLEYFSCTVDFLYGKSQSPSETWEEQKKRDDQSHVDWINASIDSFITYQKQYGDFTISDTKDGYLVEWNNTRRMTFSRSEFEGFMTYIQKTATLFLDTVFKSKQDSLIQEMYAYETRKKRHEQKLKGQDA